MSSPRSTPDGERLTAGRVASHLGVMLAVATVMGVVVAGLAIPFAGVVGIGARDVAKTMDSLPEELKTEALPQKTTIVDSRGNVVATLYDENRVTVPLSQISRTMVKAIVAIEDYRFYQHGALDLKGTLRALVTNQANDGTTQGGSSITQQMAKMTAVMQARTDAERKAATADTYQRKILELRHAIAFEQNYSKDWILDRYLNIAYFGDGAYGIQSAARHYFSVDAKDLNVRQSALLAGMVKNPVGYDPTRFPQRAKARRHIVLTRLAQLKVISQPLADKIDRSSLGLKITPNRNGCLGSDAPFFCDYVRRYLMADPALGRTVADRKQLLNNGGLTIKTTLRMPFQSAADKATSAHVRPTDQAIGALAMVEPGTGNVEAISQSRPMGRDGKKGETFLNYVVDSKYGDSAGFQAGSTFKLFVLAAALEMGLPTSTTFHSPPFLSIPQNDFQDCNGPYPVYAPYPVHNSTKSGTFDMYVGTQESVNTYFAQLEQKTGLCRPYDLAKQMGVQLTDPDHERVPAFTLGVADVSPLEMAGAYATVAARGIHCENRPVTEILNSEGKLFKRYTKKCRRVLSENTADTINDILRGVMEGGFGNALQLAGHQSAAKTGTTQDNVAVWFDGYTPSLATSAMIAGANSKGHPITLNNQVVGGSYIGTAHGSTIAGPMWADAMRAISGLLPATTFTPPQLSNAPANSDTQTTAPNVIGMNVDQARSALEGIGMSVVVGEKVPSDAPAGTIVAENPGAGQSVPVGSTFYLYPSSGSKSSGGGNKPGGGRGHRPR